mmetsp:Transcript_26541/g.60529  ORF Transcript_26541/g.60529 Transcript_26541/m.60529 type:complete len:227 (-) Transcript_26541:1436-2116(-)
MPICRRPVSYASRIQLVSQQLIEEQDQSNGRAVGSLIAPVQHTEQGTCCPSTCRSVMLVSSRHARRQRLGLSFSCFPRSSKCPSLHRRKSSSSTSSMTSRALRKQQTARTCTLLSSAQVPLATSPSIMSPRSLKGVRLRPSRRNRRRTTCSPSWTAPVDTLLLLASLLCSSLLPLPFSLPLPASLLSLLHSLHYEIQRGFMLLQLRPSSTSLPAAPSSPLAARAST